MDLEVWYTLKCFEGTVLEVWENQLFPRITSPLIQQASLWRHLAYQAKFWKIILIEICNMWGNFGGFGIYLLSVNYNVFSFLNVAR